ncbi:MAG: protein kinase [Candidatus Latescibacteria bacterium]|nr:protein kinase [Candidatus Latescibacterota bacterium]NIM21459.1 protein kinase [Candidatus Latescibacterota bacterium]NIM65630.1 protein kinase [Candidatus Latescibacterota bacterium]NIO02011.1 protein kinase [Candidatus Latescibacterota bacterium]NIO28823.1 protein kinase [Candidatus Latescibacterota bacterium]
MIGQTVSHYKILEELGGGGMGVVYKAEDTKLKRTVALKFLPPYLIGDKDAKTRFIHEAQAASKLQHHNICTIHEIGETKDRQLFISMDCYEGETLKEKIARGPLPISETIDIAIQVAAGLSKAHDAGMVHRDLKPGNIIVTSDGVVKILDFGLAKLPGMSKMAERYGALGTIAYMSPEQAGGTDVDERSDVFSLGVVMYELLTGQTPFKGDYDAAIIYSILNLEPKSLRKIREEVPAELEEIVLKAIAKHPAERYQLAGELLTELRLAKKKIKTGLDAWVDESQPSIAVLPFANMSTDREQDYFCDGMAEDIINKLSKIAGLRVAARTSCFAYKGKSEDVREIGKNLGVDTVLEGGVRKAGDRIRITVQLINVKNGYQVWSGRFDRDLEDVFVIQDEIGRNIVEALEVKLTDKEKRVLDKVPTRDVEAYDFYIRGRLDFHKLGAKPLERARNLFTSAIITDPEYAVAYCGLADCHSMLYMYFNSDKTNIENAVTASKKALKLDPELAESHASYGLAISLDRKYEQAESEFRKAIQLSPKLYEPYYFFARMYWVRGDLRKAAEFFVKASMVRQEDYQALLLAANAYRGLNQVSKLEGACRRGLEIAERHVLNEPDDARAWYLGAQALCELGDKKKALEWIERAMSLDPDDPMSHYNAACVYSLLGMFDEFFTCFERAMESMSGRAYREWCKYDPYLDPVREDPRYSRLMERY